MGPRRVRDRNLVKADGSLLLFLLYRHETST